jgi:hypothetical protein
MKLRELSLIFVSLSMLLQLQPGWSVAKPLSGKGACYPAQSAPGQTIPQNAAPIVKLINEADLLKKDIGDVNAAQKRFSGLSFKRRVELSQNVERILEDARQLADLTRGNIIPQLYAVSLSNDADLMEQVRLAPVIGKKEVETVAYVQENTELKRIDASQQTAAQKARNVPIIITTLRGTNASGVYEVLWRSKRGDDKNDEEPQTFPHPSDERTGEARNELPPGVYKMWTRSLTKSKAKGEKKTVRIGQACPDSPCRDYLIAVD